MRSFNEFYRPCNSPFSLSTHLYLLLFNVYELILWSWQLAVGLYSRSMNRERQMEWASNERTNERGKRKEKETGKVQIFHSFVDLIITVYSRQCTTLQHTPAIKNNAKIRGWRWYVKRFESKWKSAFISECISQPWWSDIWSQSMQEIDKRISSVSPSNHQIMALKWAHKITTWQCSFIHIYMFE